ncbi:MAG: hypothetical protein KF696_13610 [Planctomycetes bacterium]|nr:hypothetical protein [Planctomycetota bacterium]MCW8137088.1 hypothetical protein [Planctomycetota bacterium]
MRATVTDLRFVPVLLLVALLGTACSVMPFQGNARSSNSFVSEDSGAKPAGPVASDNDPYPASGEGAPGNMRDNPGGERSGSAGIAGAERKTEEAAKGQGVGKDDKDGRQAFDNDRRRDVEFRWLRERALVAKQAGDLEGAEDYLLRALDLKPEGNTGDVKALLDEVRSLLSKGEDIVPRSSKLPAAAQQEYEIEADRTYREAKAYEAAGKWGEAIDSWERLLRIIKFAPYGAELSRNYQALAESGLQNARTEIARQRKVLEEEALKRELRMNDLRKQAEEERRKEEIVELWRQAVYNVELRRFKTAGEIVDRILYLDPQFRKAEELKREIEDRKLIAMNRETFEARIASYQNTLRVLREAIVPEVETLKYPTGLLAERIKSRRARAADAIQTDPEIQRIQNILSTKIIPLNPDATPLTEVISDIRRRANVNIQLSKEVAANSGSEEVSISLEDIPVGSALGIILNDLGLTTQFRYGILFVVEQGAEADASSVVTRVHDVRDLTFNIQEFAGPRLRLLPADDSGGGPVIVYPDESERTLDIDRIEELITESVAPDTWSEPNALKFFGGQLVATHTPQVQAELRDFLDELRKIAGLMVNVEVRFISVEDDFLQDFGIDFRGLGGPANVPNQANILLEDITTGAEDFAGGQFDNGSGGIAPTNPSGGIFFNNQDPNNPPVNFNQDIRGRFEHIYDNALGNILTNNGGFAMQFAYFVDLTQINAVIHAVQKRKKARVLTAPRLTAFNTQRANITVVNQVPYIRDFELNAATSAAIANPVVDTILDGMVLDVKPTISNDRRFVTIEVQPTVAELLLPIPTFTTTLGPTSTVTLQLPEIRLQTVQTTVRVPDGGAVVIAGLKTVRDKWVESGVPILSDIPLLGVLFKRQGRSKEQFNLVIVVHARVIDLNDEELRKPGWS